MAEPPAPGPAVSAGPPANVDAVTPPPSLPPPPSRHWGEPCEGAMGQGREGPWVHERGSEGSRPEEWRSAGAGAGALLDAPHSADVAAAARGNGVALGRRRTRRGGAGEVREGRAGAGLAPLKTAGGSPFWQRQPEVLSPPPPARRRQQRVFEALLRPAPIAVGRWGRPAPPPPPPPPATMSHTARWSRRTRSSLPQRPYHSRLQVARAGSIAGEGRDSRRVLNPPPPPPQPPTPHTPRRCPDAAARQDSGGRGGGSVRCRGGGSGGAQWSRLESEGGEAFVYLHIIMVYDSHNIFRTLRRAPAAEAGAGGALFGRRRRRRQAALAVEAAAAAAL